MRNHADAVEVTRCITDQVLELQRIFTENILFVVVAVVGRVLQVRGVVAVVAVNVVHGILLERAGVAVTLSQQQRDVDLIILVQIREIREPLLLVRRVVDGKAISCGALLLQS